MICGETEKYQTVGFWKGKESKIRFLGIKQNKTKQRGAAMGLAAKHSSS